MKRKHVKTLKGGDSVVGGGGGRGVEEELSRLCKSSSPLANSVIHGSLLRFHNSMRRLSRTCQSRGPALHDHSEWSLLGGRRDVIPQ